MAQYGTVHHECLLEDTPGTLRLRSGVTMDSFDLVDSQEPVSVMEAGILKVQHAYKVKIT